MTTNARDEKWSEWIDWSGGECPLPDGVNTEVKLRGAPGDERLGFSDKWEWSRSGYGADIIAYRYRLDDNQMTPEEEEIPAPEWAGSVPEGVEKYSPYFKDVRHIEYIDVYRTVDLFGCEKHGHPISHAAKKLLLSGSRTGGKDVEEDVREAIDTLHRWLEMREEDRNAL